MSTQAAIRRDEPLFPLTLCSWHWPRVGVLVDLESPRPVNACEERRANEVNEGAARCGSRRPRPCLGDRCSPGLDPRPFEPDRRAGQADRRPSPDSPRRRGRLGCRCGCARAQQRDNGSGHGHDPPAAKRGLNMPPCQISAGTDGADAWGLWTDTHAHALLAANRGKGQLPAVRAITSPR